MKARRRVLDAHDSTPTIRTNLPWDLDREGIDLVVHAPALAGRRARVSVGIARGPHEDDLLRNAGLGHGRNRLAEVVPELLLAVVVDDAVEAEAQVEEVHGPPAVPPPEDVVEQGRIVGISVAQRRQRHRDIVAAARAERDREHGDVRTRSDTGQGGGDTRDRGAMREPVARLVGRSGQELLGDRLALEERVALVDPGVDDADGYSLARSGVGALVAGDVGMGPIHVDRAQAPLVVELNPRGGRPGQRRGPPTSSPATAERRQRTEKRRPACNLRPAHEHVPLARPETGCRRPASG